MGKTKCISLDMLSVLSRLRWHQQRKSFLLLEGSKKNFGVSGYLHSLAPSEHDAVLCIFFCGISGLGMWWKHGKKASLFA